MNPKDQANLILRQIPKRQKVFDHLLEDDLDFSDIQTDPLNWDVKNVAGPRPQRSLLWKKIQEHTGDPRLVEIASRIIKAYDIPERDNYQLVKGFKDFVQNKIKYFRESPERFVSPVRTVKWGIGDCDDKTILFASLVRTFRIPVRLKFIRFISPKTNRKVSHVYPQVGIDGRWTTVETVHDWPIGKDGEQSLKNRNISILSVEYIGDKNARI
jgi:transglutaminase-like putative cysteine protease